MNKLKYFIKRGQIPFTLLLIVILFLLIPPIVNKIITTDFLPPSQFFNFITPDNQGAWIDFYGALVGGGLTLLGVVWTIVDQSNKRREDIKDSIKPTLVSTHSGNETIDIINQKYSFACSLNYKNIGKGILYNPEIYNIMCSVENYSFDDIGIGGSISSYMDINESLVLDLRVTLQTEKLHKIYQQFNNKRNVATIKLIIWIGGKDIFGRDTVTKLKYAKTIIFRSADQLEIGLPTVNYSSELLFDEKEIANIINSANPKYKIFR